MNYLMHYNALIDRAKARSLDGYVERHHVVPKCMGGTDDLSNIVCLTPEEHFVAHQLLVKINPGEKKPIYAAWAMTRGSARNNKKFGWLKRLRSEAQRGTKLSEEARQKISMSRRGQKLSPERAAALHEARRNTAVTDETKLLLSKALTGKPKSKEHREALSASRRNMQYTPELREKLAANRGKKLNEKQYFAFVLSNKGKTLSDEQKAKISEANKGLKRKIVSCPHCGKSGGDGIMKRWHFENCKENSHGSP